MRLCNCEITRLHDVVGTAELICFGVSKHIDTIIKQGYTQWLDKVKYFVDNSAELQGTEVTYNGKRYQVLSPDVLEKEESDTILMITAFRLEAVSGILSQLNSMRIAPDVRCFSVYMMERFGIRTYDDSAVNISAVKGIQKIEKKIHCCWFSGDPKPQKYLECIDSWKKNCPDYEIIEWNANTYDVTKNQFMKRAYEMRAWAFASDYARLDLVYNNGGIYLDMDVELLKPLDDFLGFDAFFSFQKEDECIDLGSGFGARAKLPLLKELLDEYKDLEFCKGQDTFSSRDIIAQPEMLCHIFEKNGYVINSASQVVGDTIYLSPDYIRTVSDPTHDRAHLTGDEYAVHWHHAGWYGKDRQAELEKEVARGKQLLELGWERVDKIG